MLIAATAELGSSSIRSDTAHGAPTELCQILNVFAIDVSLLRSWFLSRKYDAEHYWFLPCYRKESDLAVQRFNVAKPFTCHAVALCVGGSLDEDGFVVKMDTFVS
jgi:hypothetical protein